VATATKLGMPPDYVELHYVEEILCEAGIISVSHMRMMAWKNNGPT